jgi:radical SAM superfamily enzyme YgiQ (UPF0313 family)
MNSSDYSKSNYDKETGKLDVVFIGVYQYWNPAIRILRPYIARNDGVEAHCIFYKKYVDYMYNPPTPKEEKIFIEVIKKINPKIVGLSLLSPYIEICRRLTELIKMHTKAIVIAGGTGPTLEPEEHIKYADIICKGDGEESVQELILAVRDGKDYKNIPNLWVKDGEKIIRNPMRPRTLDLDSLPVYDLGHKNYHFIDSDTLHKYDPEVDNHTYFIQTSRGCPYSCNFCVESMFHDIYKDLGKFVRRRSVDNVIQELKSQFSKRDNRKTNIDFIDEVFGSNALWIEEFAPRYKKEIGVPFNVRYHPKTLKPRIIKKLIEAGVTSIGFGLQSGSDRIRNEVFERPGTNAEAISLAHEIDKYKSVKIMYDLILDNDFETKVTLKETINLILQLPKPHYFNIFSLQHFPSYGLTQKAIDSNLLTKEELGSWHDQMINTTVEWKFRPRWKKRKRTKTNQLQRLNNIIFLLAGNRAKDSVVKYAVFGHSLGSRLVFHYLNIKAIILGSLYGPLRPYGTQGSGYYWKWSYFLYKNKFMSYTLTTIKMIFKGQFKELIFKIRKIINRTFSRTSKTT